MIEIIELLKKKIDDLSKIRFFPKKKLGEIDIIMEKLTDDIDINKLHQKQNLVAKLLNAKSDNEGFKEFKRILNGEFMDFANKESSLPNEAEAVLILQSIEKELETIVAQPDLHTKNTIAIGGGFSSGKSEFISSFFNSDLKLPIGIAPTTAIPTYVINHDKIFLIGCNNKGGTVNLADVDKDFQSKLSHEFIKSFDFNLREIMPFMVLSSSIDYTHICFIDTPGYNPSDMDGGHTSQDTNIAKEFLSNSPTFIWLIEAGSGTIPKSDLDFLSDLNLEHKKIYIILNKSDLKGKTDIESILDEIEESLDDYDIKIEGLSAYSSTNKKEYAYRKMSLIDFITSCNTKSKTHENLIIKLYEVYRMYKIAIDTALDKKTKMRKTLNSIELDFLEDSYENKKVRDRLNDIKKYFDSKDEKKDSKLLTGIFKDFEKSINMIFKSKLKNNIKHIIDDNIKNHIITQNNEE